MAEPKKDRPRFWVRIVEAHATRTWVAIILAFSAGISLIMLVAAGMWNTISNPQVTDLSSNYASAISATLGVLIGSLATYVGNSATQQNLPDNNQPPRDDEFVFEVDPPEDSET